MYTVYISRYKDGESIGLTPLCIYDRRSPNNELACLNPKIALEDSRAGSFSFILPPSHYAVDKIIQEQTMVTVCRLDHKEPVTPDGADFLKEKMIFEGPIKGIYKTFDKNIQYTCEGFFTFFNDSVQPYIEYFDISLEDFVKALINKHNVNQPVYKQFDVNAFECDVRFPETDYSGQKNHLSQFEATQYETTMSYLMALQEAYGGHFIFSKHSIGDPGYVEGTTPPYIIKYLKDLPINSGQTIEFGNNLSDYDISYDLTNVCSTVVPVSSVSSDDLSTVGEIIVSSDKVFWLDYSVDPPQRHYYEPDIWADYTDENGVACMAKYYPNNTAANKYIVALFYPDRSLEKRSGIPGHYTPSDITWGGSNAYRVIRYFIREGDERLYISSRLNDLSDPYRGMWTVYAYKTYSNILGYGEQTEDGFQTIVDYEINVSKTENGQELYADHSENVGELLVAGWGDDVPTCIKRAKYSYSVDHTVGVELQMYKNSDCDIQRQPNMDPEDPSWQPPWKYNPFPEPGMDYYRYEIDTDHDEVLLLTVRTMGSGDGVDYIGDGLWALYDGLEAGSSNQLNYAKKNNEGFTSVINYKIDLKAADNVGAKLLLVSSYGVMIPPELHRYNRYSDKLEKYLTVEGADADRYHEAKSIYVTSPELEETYGRIERKIGFQGIEDPNVLLKRSEAYLVDSQWADVEVNITAIDLHTFNPEVEAFNISTQVWAKSYPHNLDRLFSVKSISFTLDQPDSEMYKFTEASSGYYKGLLPISVLTSTNEIRNVTLYGTTNGIGTLDSSTNKYVVHITITNLTVDTDPVTPGEQHPVKTYDIVVGDTVLVYPNSVEIGKLDDFVEGLIEITTTESDILDSSKPTIEFTYDKDKNGS